MHATVCNWRCVWVQMAEFTSADLSVLLAMWPKGRRYRGPDIDVFAVYGPAGKLPALLIARRNDGTYTQLECQHGLTCRAGSIADLLQIQGLPAQPVTPSLSVGASIVRLEERPAKGCHAHRHGRPAADQRGADADGFMSDWTTK